MNICALIDCAFRHLSMSVNAGKRNPELIHLLGMHSHLAPLRNGKMVSLTWMRHESH